MDKLHDDFSRVVYPRRATALLASKKALAKTPRQSLDPEQA